MNHVSALAKSTCVILIMTCTFLNEACTTLGTQHLDASNSDKLPQYWLTTSMYSGRFYDSEQLNLLDNRPFLAINDVETVDGFILYPPKAQSTIPAGTLVKILEVSYPDETNKLKRPIFSPRDHIWVYLAVGRERGKVSVFHEKPHVLVIPKTISNEKQLRGYLGRFFSKNDPNVQFLTLASHIQHGIFSKRPVIGMTKADLQATLGIAIKKQFQKKADFQDALEIWHFHDYLITFANGVVKGVKTLTPSSKSTADH